MASPSTQRESPNQSEERSSFCLVKQQSGKWKVRRKSELSTDLSQARPHLQYLQLLSASQPHQPATPTTQQRTTAAAPSSMPVPQKSGQSGTAGPSRPHQNAVPLPEPSIAMRLSTPSDRAGFRTASFSYDSSKRKVTPAASPQHGSIIMNSGGGRGTARMETPTVPSKWPGMRPSSASQKPSPSAPSPTAPAISADSTAPPPSNPFTASTITAAPTQVSLPLPPAKRDNTHLETPATVPEPAPSLPEPSTMPLAAPGRGRPKGWKPGMSYSSMRGKDPTAITAAAQRPPRSTKPKQLIGTKRRGRPPRATALEIYATLDANFVAFLCEWAGCRAELHNLETLRRHVDIVHVQTQDDNKGGCVCSWGKCGGRDDSSSPVELMDAAELGKHLEEVHLVPLSWHVGDGPTNTSDHWTSQPEGEDEDGDGEREEEIPDYLKDKDGNQVTPSIRDQKIEDKATYREKRRKLEKLLRERDENLPDAEEGKDDSNEGTSGDVAA